MDSTRDTHADTRGPIGQLRTASRSPGALALGALLGGFVPIASALTAHYGRLLEYRSDGLHVGPWLEPRWAIVFGGLAFSAKSVYQWSKAAFCGDVLKAAGFVALLECTLLLAPLPELQCAAAAYLILINMLSAGSALAGVDRAQTERLSSTAAVYPTVDTALSEGQTALLTALPEPMSEPLALPSEVSAPVSDAATEHVSDYDRAVRAVTEAGEVSLPRIRAAVSCGNSKAVRLMRELEQNGVVSAPDSSGRRTVLAD